VDISKTVLDTTKATTNDQ